MLTGVEPCARATWRVATQPFDYCAELGNRRGVEQPPQRQIDLQSIVHAGDALCGQQGMPAELEKILMQANVIDLRVSAFKSAGAVDGLALSRHRARRAIDSDASPVSIGIGPGTKEASRHTQIARQSFELKPCKPLISESGPGVRAISEDVAETPFACRSGEETVQVTERRVSPPRPAVRSSACSAANLLCHVDRQRLSRTSGQNAHTRFRSARLCFLYTVTLLIGLFSAQQVSAQDCIWPNEEIVNGFILRVAQRTSEAFRRGGALTNAYGLRPAHHQSR